MEYLVTFLEGVVTFISPCILPMLPIYLAYFAGGVNGTQAGGPEEVGRGTGGPGAGTSQAAVPSEESLASRDDAVPGGGASGPTLRRTLVCALGFVAGFTLLFTAMGALAGAAGGLLSGHQRALDAACGLIVVAFGLNYLGVLRIPALQRTLRLGVEVVPRGFASSLLFGAVFAIGWTPCVGAFLGSALGLAATTGQAGLGVALLLCYSLGLGVPFVLSAVLVDRLESAFSWVKRHYRLVNAVCGGLLVAVGVLMATGQLGTWLRLLAG